MPVRVAGGLVCSSSLLIRGTILPAVRQKLHLPPCPDFRSQLYLHAVRQAAAYSPIIDGQPSKQTSGVSEQEAAAVLRRYLLMREIDGH
ncbi:hypothetical protein BDS110ZK4_72990 [Bradyrhizobium diazoefficiens]|jgi:hypothetical protein